MKKLPILIFIVLCLTAVATSYGSYRKAQRNIESDLQQALAKTINEKGVETMRQDSIRAYRSIARTEGEMMTIAVGDETLRRHLRNQQLGEMAFITYTVGRERGRWNVTFNTEAKCSAAMIWSLSDQRLPAWLTVMALLSLALSFRGRRQSQPITMDISVLPISLLCSSSSWRCLSPLTPTVCQSMKSAMHYGQRRMMLARHYIP